MSDTKSSPVTEQGGVLEPTLRRGLRARHLNMIAIGGAIGTGLFLASGGTITEAGPGGALLAYAAIGLMVFLLMQSLGEMAAYCPSSGAFETYASRYVSKSFGFAQGWNYWYNWAITVAAELVAATIIMQYWLPNVPAWIWSLVFLLILFGLNAFSVKGFGESEFWFAGIKVVTVIVFLIIGIAMIFGILGGQSPGFENWTKGDAPFVNGWMGVMGIFMIAGFSFQGTEMIGVAAGETEDPEKNVPKATRAVFFRILLFYVGAIAIIGFLLPYTSPELLQGSSADSETVEGFVEAVRLSPFTLIFEKAGILGAASVMNAIILTSILSAGNSGMYVSTRMLYSLAKEGKAPKMFTKLTSHGVPLNALLATTAVGMLCFLTSLIGSGAAYLWLVNASGLAGFITWLGIALSHYRFRKAFYAQGHKADELPYRALFYPAGPLVALVMCIVVIIGQSQSMWINGITFKDFMSAYIGLLLFVAVWLGHKLVTRSPIIDPKEANLERI